jgi:hypothetical protein
MIISLEETFALLNKWKEQSALLAVAGENPFRDMLRGIEDREVRWCVANPSEYPGLTPSGGSLSLRDRQVVYRCP